MPRQQIVFQSGHSLALSIPNKVAKRMGISLGQKAFCEPDIANYQLTYHFPDAKQLSLLASEKKKTAA